MTAKLWTNWALKLHTLTAQSAGAVHLSGIQDVSVGGGPQTSLESGDGSVYASFASLARGDVNLSFSSSDLKALLDECGVTGMLVDDDGTHPGIVAFAQRMTQGGTRDAAGASTHISITVGNGLMLLRSLQLSHQGAGVVSGEVLGISADGSAAPVAFDEAADLTAATNPAITQQWTLGKVDLNGTPVDGLKSVSIDFGVQAVRESADSDIYSSIVSVRSINPSVSLNGIHPDILATITEAGAEYAASQVVVYAKKRDEGGTFVADGTAEHIKLTLGKCRVDWRQVTGDPKTISLVLTPWDTPGGVAPMAINTASAIT